MRHSASEMFVQCNILSFGEKRLISLIITYYYNILSSSQYGFRTNLSTSLAVMELIEEITNATDNKKHAIGVFIDLKKAFDTVDHRILIKKIGTLWCARGSK